MDRGMDQDQVGIGQREPLARGLPTMGRPVVHHPEDPLTRAVGFLVHHLVHESPKRLDPGVWFAASHNVSTANIPPCQVLQRAATLVLECDVGRPPGSGWQAWMAPDPGLDLHSAHCRKGLCSRVRQNLPPGYARLIDGYLRQLFIDLYDTFKYAIRTSTTSCSTA
jgi:hypothetical protein